MPTCQQGTEALSGEDDGEEGGKGHLCGNEEGDTGRSDGAQAKVGRGPPDPELHNPEGNDPGQRGSGHLENAGRVQNEIDDGDADKAHNQRDAYDCDGMDSLHPGAACNGAAAETARRQQGQGNGNHWLS